MTHMTHTQEMTQDGDNVIKDDDVIPVLRHLALRHLAFAILQRETLQKR